MYCRSCGKENNENAGFCINCGQPLPNGRIFAENSIMLVHDADTINDGTDGRKTGRIKDMFRKSPAMIILLCVIISGLFLIAFIAFRRLRTPVIDLEEYLIIEPEGYDGYGTVRFTFDWNGLRSDRGDDITLTDSAKKKLGLLKYFADPFDVLRECIIVNVSEESSLSNGDVITYKVEATEDISEILECRFRYPEGEYEVSGLSKIGYFDPFDDITVDFSGISPRGKASFEYDGEEMSESEFSIDRSSNLSNGDVVTVSVSDHDMTYYLENLGRVPMALSRSYKVSGLSGYVQDYSELDDSFIREISSQAEDIICSYAARKYAVSSALGDLRYEGYFMNTSRDTDGNPEVNNSLIVIYSGIVSNSTGAFRATRVYFPVMFVNITTGAGTEYESDYGILGSSTLDGTDYKTAGYTNPITCYRSLTMTYGDSYVMVCGDGFDKYSDAYYSPVCSLDDIGASCRAELRTEAQDMLESRISHFVSGNLGYCSLKSISCLGEYLVMAKSQSFDFMSSNSYFIVFSVEVTNPSNGREYKVYMPVAYHGIGNLPDDEFFVTKTGGVKGNFTPLSYRYSGFGGYDDGTRMYREIITSNRENCTYDISPALKQFGE